MTPKGQLKILVVDDDSIARRAISMQLRGSKVDFAFDAEAGRRKIEGGGYDISFIDLQLGPVGDESGLALVPLASKAGAYTVLITGHDSQLHIDRAYELGCDDVYVKGNESENVQEVLTRFARKRQTEGEDGLFRDLFVTEDPATREAVTQAIGYAASDIPVLILGPSGTGKTSLAEVIHGRSGRRGQFVSLNCAAHAEDLLEAELFGYRKGAFTGAAESRRGKFLMADGGTLFLDEIGAMSPAMQKKLLKAVEEKSFYPLGSDRPERSDFRLVSATLEDLAELVRKGAFRFDLLQRVQGATVELRPLAARKCDILPLAAFFTRGKRRLSFEEKAKQELLSYDWPGNVRELKKFVDLAVADGPGRVGAQTVKRLLRTRDAGSKP